MSDQVRNALRISLLAALILWGTYTFFQYLTVSVHQLVLLSDSAKQAVETACPANGWFCVGTHAILPSIANTIGRAQPFVWYIVISLLIYGTLIAIEFFRSGRGHIRFTLSPLKLWLLFVAFLWLLFTVLSNGNDGDQPFRRLYQPSSQVYTNASPETISILLDDYNKLKQQGCLIEVQNASQGVEVSDVRESCMQASFVKRVFTEVLSITFLLFVFLSIGRFFLRLLRIETASVRMEALFSAGLGACALIVILWLIALFGIYTQPVGWALIFLLPLLVWRHALHWLRIFMKHTWTYEGAWYDGGLLLGWLLLSYLVLNFLTVVRPFPIGWDDLGVYLNDPRLLVSYGHMIPRMSNFQWEFITSLGFLLFGYDQYFGATTSLLINWMAGLLAVSTVYVFASTYFGRKKGFVAALLFYTLPLIGHFSFADMKVDNAVFTTGALAVFAVCLALFPPHEAEEHVAATTDEYMVKEHDHQMEHDHPIPWRLLILAGIFAGFGFGMKPTTSMVVMAIDAIIVGAMMGGVGFAGAVSLAWCLFTQQGAFSVKDIGARAMGNPAALSRTGTMAFFFIIGAILIGIGTYLKPRALKKAVIAVSIFMVTFLVCIAPWIIRNNILRGNVIPALALSAPNDVTPAFLYMRDQPITTVAYRQLPADLQVDPTDPSCVTGTSKSEELDRYWGYSEGWGHYIGLPWRTVMNADSAGYYVTTMPGLLLFVLVVLLPYFWTRAGRWLRWLWLGTGFMVVEWVFFANGVPWYGIGMFLGLTIGLEALVSKAPDRATKIAASVFIFLSLIVTFANRFWQFEQQRNLYDYSFGVISGYAMEERTIPHYGGIRDIVLQRAETMPDRPYLYRIGTFIPYFIPKNLEVIPVADHQLDMFTCLNAEHDPAKTVARLKALGFNSIIFDTNTQTIERDQNGTLHKKVQQFVNFLNTPDIGLQLVVNDPNNGVAFIVIQ